MKSKLKPVLIYHGGCPDGFGAAYAFWKKYGDEIEYIPLAHKEVPFKGLSEDTFRGRKVWMVDIALEKDDTIRAHEIASEFMVIDHHLSAQKEMDHLEFCHFDMEHSGAILAWNYCFPDEEAPKLLQYVEDRDLWGPDGCKIPYAKEVLTSVDSCEKTFPLWEDLHKRFEDPVEFSRLLAQGSAVLEYNKVLMKRIKANTYFANIKGYEVPIVNTPFFRSELLGQLAIGASFSAGYHYDGESFVFSLRSTDEGIDVSEVASKFPGGGGHRNASGFSIKSLSELSD